MFAVVPERRRGPRSLVARIPISKRVRGWLFLSGLVLGLAGLSVAETLPGISYTNHQVPQVPWSIHVIQVERAKSPYEVHSWHARGKALGLSTLSEQVDLASHRLGEPVAAVNGDFYQRERGYAGHPRGLQIVEGEVISAPSSSVSFWADALGDFHCTNVVSQFQITWPDGTITPFGLNEDRRPDEVVLYTPAVGASTRTQGGREFILEPQDPGAWLPLRMGRIYVARVKEMRDQGNCPLAAGRMVLSVGRSVKAGFKEVGPGAVVRIGTGSVPNLRGVRTAISGGPVLLRDGKKQKFRSGFAESYEFSSMNERHPRAAVGWNDKSLFLVEVDGRQRDLSMGMTLDELSAYMLKLGCTDAMNFDGGGSATLWFDGEVRNSPCDGRERDLANSLLVVKKPPQKAEAATASSRQ